MLKDIIAEAKALEQVGKVKMYENYLQIKPGGYGEGDKIWAISMPNLRLLGKKYKGLDLVSVFELLEHEVHDMRMLALHIFEYKFALKSTSDSEREMIVKGYLARLQFVNNWDLVDTSCYKILGSYVFINNKPELLIDLANSDNMWENRVAMVATLYHIRKKQFDLPLQLAEKLLHHKHDIMHKAVGWMLREVGKRDKKLELEFLAKHYKVMPRTSLRYAIEKFDENLRQAFLQGTF